MKFFRKVHFWKDHRTYLEIEGKHPEFVKGYPREGFIVIKIGEQSSVKSAFKLDIDEARCMRDQLNLFLRMHDANHTKLLNSQIPPQQPPEEDYAKYKKPPSPEPEQYHDESVQKPFFLFSDEGEEEHQEPEEEKDEAEFYF